MCKPHFVVFVLLTLYSIIHKSVTEEIYLKKATHFDDELVLDSSFVSNLLTLFNQSEVIYTAFEKTIETSKNKQVYSKVMEDWASSFKLPEPSTTAESIYGSLSHVSDVITPFLFEKAIAKTYQNLLRDYGVLTEPNANDLAENYFKYLETECLKIEPRADAHKYVKALMEGTSKFLDSTNVMTPNAIQVLIIYFYKEMLDLKFEGEYI